MAFFTWQEKFSVGIDGIDRDHMILVDLIDQLHDLYALGKGQDDFSPLFDTLLDYTDTHFANEERLMAASGYPDLSAHQAEHRALRCQVLDIRARFLADESRKVAVELLGFLHHWLYFHILDTDMAYRPFLAAKGVARPAAGAATSLAG